MLYIALSLILILCHAPLMGNVLTKIRSGFLPSTADFGALSVMLCYDLGFAVEAFGYPNEQEFVPSLFSVPSGTFITAFLFILSAPWAFQIGSYLVTANRYQQRQEPRERLKRKRRALFYALTLAVVILLCFMGCYRVLSGADIWTTRAEVGQEWGTLILVLYVPLHLLAFYVRQADSRHMKARVYTAILLIASVCSTLPIGQRTNIILPFVIICLFGIRMSTTRITTAGAILVTLAVVLLPWFKWQHSSSSVPFGEQVSTVIHGDISRTGVIGAAIEESLPVGTRILPYPMSGYVYSLLFYAPRPLAPFKGIATAYYFTAYLAHTNPLEIDWGLGIGAIEEAILNLGTLLVVPVLLLYGVCFGWLDRLSFRFPSLVVPTRLGALWVCDYHLPAILLVYGTMAVIELILEFWIAEPASELT